MLQVGSDSLRHLYVTDSLVKLAEALRLEVVGVQAAQIAQGWLCVGDDWRPQMGRRPGWRVAREAVAGRGTAFGKSFPEALSAFQPEQGGGRRDERATLSGE